MGYASAIGGLLGIAGTALIGSEAGKKKAQAQALANTPGLDFGAITGGALAGYEQNYAQASKLASQLSQSNQSNLSAQEEQALPGVGAARQKALSQISSLFGDDSEWLKGVQRRGAALGLSSGLYGSGAGQLQTLHLSDQEQQQRTQLGTGLLSSLIGGMRLANTPGVQAFLGPTIQEQVQQRSQERTQHIGLQQQANGMPSALGVWGNELQQVGHALAGVGATSGGGGFGGGGAQSGGGWNTPYFNGGDASALSNYGSSGFSPIGA